MVEIKHPMLAVRRVSAAAGFRNGDVNIHPDKPVG